MKLLFVIATASAAFIATSHADDHAMQAASSANAYAFETFQLFRQITDGNFCYSPYSSQRIAAMVAEGARGATAEELLKLAHLAQDNTARQAESKALSDALASTARSGGLQLEVANSLWAPPTFPFAKEFKQMAADQFGAAAETLPADDPVKAAMAVNAWIKQRTRGRITNLAGPAMFSPRSLALVNTIYLKAAWQHPFEPTKTKPRAFLLPSGNTTTVPTMLQMEAFNYGEGQCWQSLELPMKGGEVSMTFLLPSDGTARKKIEEKLSAETWKAVTSAFEDCDVNVKLPRFSFSTELSMTSMWRFLGARLVCDDSKADLTGMIPQGGHINEVVHQATIEVNEIGAEASAATIAEPFAAAAAPTPSRRKVSFIANRPFLWMITHRSSGLILFLGRFAGG